MEPMPSGFTLLEPRWSALTLKGTDLRRFPRYGVNAGPLRVTWLDIRGAMKMSQGRVLNISQAGIALELPEAAAQQSLVRFESVRSGVRGAGAVRWCRRVGFRYVSGIEFKEALRWTSSDADGRNPMMRILSEDRLRHAETAAVDESDPSA